MVLTGLLTVLIIGLQLWVDGTHSLHPKHKIGVQTGPNLKIRYSVHFCVSATKYNFLHNFLEILF